MSTGFKKNTTGQSVQLFILPACLIMYAIYSEESYVLNLIKCLLNAVFLHTEVKLFLLNL